MDLNAKIQRKYYQNYAPQYLENRNCQRETGAKNTCKFDTQKQTWHNAKCILRNALCIIEKHGQCKLQCAQCTLHWGQKKYSFKIYAPE